jgi:hypothetical protein
MASNDRSIVHTVTGDFMDSIRENFFAAVEPDPEPAPGLSAENVPLDQWAEKRAELGLGGHNSNFIGIDDQISASGMPDWRTPVVEEAQFSAMDEYAAQRKELGVRDASAVFGASPVQPRVNASPWSVT